METIIVTKVSCHEFFPLVRFICRSSVKTTWKDEVIAGAFRDQACTFAKMVIMNIRYILGKLFQYFLQGLIILAPIVLTIYTVTALFNFIDNILPDFIVERFPAIGDGRDSRAIPGIGFVLVLVIVGFTGYISSSYLFSGAVGLFEKILENTPGIKIIYSTLRDFFEAFGGNKKKFNRPVLVALNAENVWQIGFITREDLSQFGLSDHLAVYVPKSYAFAGHLYMVGTPRIKLLPEMNPADAMKFALTGGVSEPEETRLP